MTTRNPERYQQVKDLLIQALGQPVEQREAFLAEACAGDEVLFAEVITLLSHHGEAEEADFMNEPARQPGVAPNDDGTWPPQHSAASTNAESPKQEPFATLDFDSSAAQTSRVSLRQPQRIGDFELLEKIGHGGMGVVYKARQISLGRTVALKMILTGQDASDREIQRFHSEAQAAADLDHPGIVPVFEVGESESGHYFAMGFVEGQGLDALLRDGPLSPDEAVRITKAVAEAVQYAHSKRVIHRDLKPSNILLDSNCQPRVTDFGLAKRLTSDSDLTATGQVLGTPSYMPPEQAAGKIDQVREAADVYALGASLYAMLTGRPPFQSDNAIDTIQQVLNQPPVAPRVLNPKTPRDVETICLKCLEKDAADRFESAQELADDLGRFQRGEPITARKIGLLGRTRRWVNRNQRIAMLLAAVAVVTIIAGIAVVSAWYLRQQSDELAIVIKEFNEGLDDEQWDLDHLRKLDGLIDRLEKLSPEQAAEARLRMNAALGGHIDRLIKQPSLADEGLRARIEQGLGWLATRDTTRGDTLQNEYEDRIGRQETVLKLEPPYSGIQTRFVTPGINVVGEQLVHEPTDPDKKSEKVFTREPARGNVILQIEFGNGWDRAGELGLVFGEAEGAGYHFLIRAPPATVDKDEPQPIARVRLANGDVTIAIMRDGKTLRATQIPARDLSAESLQLTATRDGDLLTFQIGDQLSLELFDYFPIAGAEQGNFGVIWPRDVAVSWLMASRQILPPTPSPLEDGDRLFSQGDYKRALEKYREQANILGIAPLSLTAKYKEAVCLLELKRDEDAIEILEEVAQSDDTLMNDAASCRLIQPYLRQGRDNDALNVLERLVVSQLAMPGKDSSRQSLASLMPQEVGDQILGHYGSEGSSVNYFRFDPELVRKQVLHVELERQLGVPAIYRGFSEQRLVRAYRAVGRQSEAIDAATRFLEQYPADTSELRPDAVAFSKNFIEELCWLLRVSGQAKKALELLDERLFDSSGMIRPQMDTLLIERARIHAALNQWKEAEQDIDRLVEAVPSEQVGFRLASEVYLMLGFVQKQNGKNDAEQTWAKAMFTGDVRDPSSFQKMAGSIGVINHLIAGALSNSLTGEEVETLLLEFASRRVGISPTRLRFLRQFASRAGFQPEMLRDMWLSERGLQAAQQWAFRGISWPEYIRLPAILFGYEFATKTSFADPSSDQQALTWETMNHGYELVSTQKLKIDFDLLGNAASTWSGSNQWASLSKQFTSDAEFRGEVAYLLGGRYLGLGRLDQAREFFQVALDDAPADSLLARLAHEELNRLNQR